MMLPPRRIVSSAQGFTLVEVMVVIVIMTIVTSLVVLNIGSIDQRRAMQARDSFILDLQRIGRESVDQSKILALSTQNATDIAPFRYGVLDYAPTGNSANSNLNNTPSQAISRSAPIDPNTLWKANPEFQLRELPNQVYFNVESRSDERPRRNTRSDSPLLSERAPQLIWFGNGEVKPVRIQFYFAEQPIGVAINIDHLGKISDAE